ncbi:TPA: hypothetical protein DEQ22_03205 [Candidatus Nomurabacteria bacterium]|uniref:Uncharacterized protein n=2 Tax=Candidatus Nomuraibacteriota TaxID=1752729 RepID=A0A1F6YPR4_9BACT|nr:MAG: hypothetical protein UV13_C0006G0035 [Parcubacteria group bacterium GW2011_GWC1_42_21]KKS58395.1 MAG: hypothetical protein UV23_C0008G0010 [Candidatus Nomurabacteria bacterium GW2011_GWF1_42_40]KKT00298.1 MAG: hypothetical protein UV77_C0005G0035 [Candidatus Nomurabacteria bacterium GW2011_GWA1_43_17]KKT08102.1 MAG: hypothetical protein UV85_C0001G0035 [Candidatus Nomurabacteria bacterium GW2011_GWB1_43_19]KKT11487.1 MAG: hypothetical protein UV91_C0005G0035 [Candidatus Nomurabacteria b
MIFKNKRIQKFVSGLMILSVLIPAVFISATPRQAEATGWPVIDLANLGAQLKKIAIEIVKQYMIHIARSLLQQMTQNTVNWINSGFHGNPLYLENPDSFFKDIAKYEIRNLVDMFGYDQLRYPFGKDFALNAIGAYQRQLADNTQYSLSKVINDPIFLDSFRNDFNVGGWNGFLINTQYQQNNYLGFQMLATEELARRVQGTSQTATQKVQTTLQQGMGFLSPKTCPSNPLYNNGKNEFLQPSFNYNQYLKDHPYDFEAAKKSPTYDILYSAGIQAAEHVWKQKNTCPGGLVATTPGSVVAGTIMEALGSNTRQAELGTVSGSIQASIATILDAFLNHFLQKGLNALGNKIYPPQEDQTLDDFIFFGDMINTVGDDIDTSVTPLPGDGMQPLSLLSDVQAERAKYGAIVQDAELGALLNAVAWKNRDAGWGLSRKDFGEQCSSPVGQIACDILYHKPSNTIFDVLYAAGEVSTPTWDALGQNTDTRRPWVAPVQP